MTGYFSIQVTEVQKLYDLTTYWVSFLVVIIVSIVGLVAFSLVTERIGGRTTYKSLTRTMLDGVRKRKNKRV